jgi:UDP-N-acetylglucosamine 2-epimerase (non-hydrolysing)
MLITIVAGARPNFIKIGPIIKAIKEEQVRNNNVSYRLVHTGQHYDRNMSGDFFDDLEIPDPDVNLGAGGGTQSEQTAAIMIRFERDLMENVPDVVLVVGDVTSTMACTIVSKKLCIPVVHVEAGIRSGDMTMPEEINRVITDSVCDHFFTTSESAGKNLQEAGVKENRIHFVGNTMIDTLYQNMLRLKEPEVWREYGLTNKKYFLITLHRPSNVDSADNLKMILDVILDNNDDLPVVFPVHPRTKKILDSLEFDRGKLIATAPMRYLEFVFLIKNATAVITDSGGITEETTVLKVPCLTVRNSTERPETITVGTNELVGTNPQNLVPYLRKIRQGEWKGSSIPALWDGNAASRILAKMLQLYSKERFSVEKQLLVKAI